MPSKSSNSRSSRSTSSSAAPPERRLSLLLLLVAANQRMTQLVERELAADGVEPNHYATLSLIGAFGPMRLTEISSQLGIALTTTSDTVRRLEGHGLVRRHPNPEDGRSFLFELTARGDREWKRGWGALQRIDEAIVGAIDVDATRDVLTELGTAFEAAMRDSDQH
jgi:DNA-binding MarR family transcriptional regulator